MTAAADHNNSLGGRSFSSGGSLPKRFQPAQKGLTHEPQGTHPEQHNCGNPEPTPKADQPHKPQDQRQAKEQQGQEEKLAEKVQLFRNNAKESVSLAARGSDSQEAVMEQGQIYGAWKELLNTG